MMNYFKRMTLIILLSISATFVTGCGGGETDYSLEDLQVLRSVADGNATRGDLGDGIYVDSSDLLDVLTPPIIDQNVSTSPSIYPVIGEVITTVGATSVSNTPIIYTLSGADASFFSIDENGNLQFIVVPDFDPAEDANGDNNFEVIVNVADDYQVTSVPISVSIIYDADRVPPSFTTLPIIYIEEGVVEGDVVSLAISAKAGVENATLTYLIESGEDAGLFTLDETTGVLRFNIMPDYEYPDDATLSNDYHLTIKVVDDTAYANVAVMDFTVQVDPVNEEIGTTYVASSDLNNLKENGQYTITFTSTPIVTTDNIIYTVMSGDENIFSINEGDNVLNIATPAVPCSFSIFGCRTNTEKFTVTIKGLDEHHNYTEGIIEISVSSE